ncbi:hypothetical protein BC833DRAFT_618536 [Globomyces pollinis-pini]|nr:hypothetical protein BC833DRAFT_618536 [Globomyces pollinis-pini]
MMASTEDTRRGDDIPSFTNSFWGENDKGLEVLITHMKNGKIVSNEVLALIKERSSIEEDYGKRLARLAKSFQPKNEIGTLRDGLEVVRNELENSARVHLELANDLRTKLEKPLMEFITTQHSIRKNHQKNLEKQLQAKISQEAVVVKAKERYELKSVELIQLNQMLRVPTTPNIEKVRTKADKVQSQVKTFDQEYQNGCNKLADIHQNWKIDMTAACSEFQNLQSARFNFIRASIWNYTNFLSSACVLDDGSYENIRVSFEHVQYETDLQMFLKSFATEPMSYMPFQGYNQQKDELKPGSLSRSQSDLSDSIGSVNYQPRAYPPQFALAQNPNDRSMDDGLGMESLTMQYDPYDVSDAIPILFTVRVLHDYQSQAKEEVSIQKDQILPVTAVHDDGWWECVVVENGRKRRGIFPSNFTENPDRF